MLVDVIGVFLDLFGDKGAVSALHSACMVSGRNSSQHGGTCLSNHRLSVPKLRT